VITTRYTAPPPGSVVVCLDEMGPESAKSFPGRELVPVQEAVGGVLPGPGTGGEASIPPPAPGPSGPTTPARRATQAIDDGRRGKGYIFGAFKPADGEALTAP